VLCYAAWVAADLKTERLTLKSKCGKRLSAYVYLPDAATFPVVMIAGATGVPQRYYRHVAAFFQGQGIAAVTFDYEGIGESRTEPIRQCGASFLSWAESDAAVVLEYCLSNAPTAVVGHSYGGHAFGLLPRANDTLGLYAFGSGAGWRGYMSGLEQLRVLTFWHLLAPAATRVLGYLPSKRLGIGGEDLPVGVYRQWKRWCSFPHYWFDDPAFETRTRFADIRVPIVAVTASDDAWAPPASVRAFMSGYANAEVRYQILKPQEHCVPTIGHMGYFRPMLSGSVWQDVATWVRQRVASATLG
jgi:predicted alpha/beta hydrolase